MLIIRDISRGGEPTWPFYATSALSFVYVPLRNVPQNHPLN